MFKRIEADLRAREEQVPATRRPVDPLRWEGEAPARSTWLRRYAGTGRLQLESLDAEMRRVILEGEGFTDVAVLQWAYLELQNDLRREEQGADDGSEWEADLYNEGVICMAERKTLTVREIGETFDVSRVTVAAWRKDPEFPAPLEGYPLKWDSRAVETWRTSKLHPDRVRRGMAVAEFERSGNVSAAARIVGRSPRTVRRWLEDAGVREPA
jgi:transposase-like protein